MSVPMDFARPDLMRDLVLLDEEGLSRLPFGVIGFRKDPSSTIVVYNSAESRKSGLDPSRVLGRALFDDVAQCMNNHLVARRFDEAVRERRALDETIDFTFTMRMKPTPVTLRLLSDPEHATQFLAVRWMV